MFIVCLLAKQHTAFTWKDAIYGFLVSLSSAEILARWSVKIKQHFIAEFLGNISAKNYQNPFMYMELIASWTSKLSLRQSVVVSWLWDLVMWSVKQLKVWSLRAGRALHSSELEFVPRAFQVTEIHQQVLYPQTRSLTDCRQLSRPITHIRRCRRAHTCAHAHRHTNKHTYTYTSTQTHTHAHRQTRTQANRHRPVDGTSMNEECEAAKTTLWAEAPTVGWPPSLHSEIFNVRRRRAPSSHVSNETYSEPNGREDPRRLVSTAVTWRG